MDLSGRKGWKPFFLAKMNEPVFHVEATYTGRVQGVGFRYQVMQIAREFEISGYVRNCADGSVLAEAEGVEEEVRAFVKEIEEQMRVFIRQVEVRTDRRAPSFSGFTIRSSAGF